MSEQQATTRESEPEPSASDQEVPEWVNLSEDEEVIWREKPAIYPYVLESKPSMIPIVIGGVLVFGGMIAMLSDAMGLALLVFALGGFFIFSGVSAIAKNVLDWWGRVYLVTTEDVYKKRGVFSRNVRNVPIGDIQKSSFNQSWLGRMLSYGHVRMATAATAGSEISLWNVGNPNEVVDMINDLADE